MKMEESSSTGFLSVYEAVQQTKAIQKSLKTSHNDFAKMIAAVVRRNIEDFHSKHLTDEQMKELNPIIRNSIYTALVKYKEDPRFMSGYYKLYVPEYWEDCEMVGL